MQLQILQMQKMQKLFCINTKNTQKQRKNTRTRSRAENRRKSVKKWQKNGKNATTDSGANDEQIRINGKIQQKHATNKPMKKRNAYEQLHFYLVKKL